MKNIYFLFFVIITFSFNAFSQIGAVCETPPTGVLSNVPFIFSNVMGDCIETNLTGEGFIAAPLTSNFSVFTIDASTQWTVTFDSPIPNLRLYCKFWRTTLVEFDQPFVILSGTSDFQNPSGNQLSTVSFSDGIIEFTNPITELHLSVLENAFGLVGLTFGLSQPLAIIDYENLNNNSIKLYPNPATNYIQFSNLDKKEEYVIYNDTGKKILNGFVSPNEKIDIRNFTTGLYFMKFENGNTIKVIKE